MVLNRKTFIHHFFLFMFCLAGCNQEEVCEGCYDHEMRFLLYNNSKRPAELVTYSSSDSDVPAKKIVIPPNELRAVGYLDQGSTEGIYFDSFKREVYSGGKLIYPDFKTKFIRVFETSEFERQGYLVDYTLFVSPIFKWCGNELCNE